MRKNLDILKKESMPQIVKATMFILRLDCIKYF